MHQGLRLVADERLEQFHLIKSSSGHFVSHRVNIIRRRACPKGTSGTKPGPMHLYTSSANVFLHAKAAATS
jgi:hypothetical protein